VRQQRERQDCDIEELRRSAALLLGPAAATAHAAAQSPSPLIGARAAMAGLHRLTFERRYRPTLDIQSVVAIILHWGVRGMRISSNSFRRHTWRRDVPEGYGGCRLTGLSVASALLLAGCSLGPAITENSADYNTTIEDVANAALVSNVLRARDHAPLYFSDLAQIRGSLQLNVQPAQTIIPYAHFLGSTTPSSVQAGPLNVNSQPGFDYAPLNTKIFAEGMLTGIDEKVFAYFVQRFVKQPGFLKLFLNLVTSRIEVYRQAGVDKAGDPKYSHIHTWAREFLPGLIARWTTPLRPPTIGVVTKDTPIGPAIPAKILAEQRGSFGNLIKVGDDENLDLSPTTKSKQAYQLSKTEQKFVLCVTTRPNSVDAVGIAPFGVTKDPDDTPIPGDNGTCGHGPVNPERYVIYTRSVEAIFFYLGELQREPELQPRPIHFYIYDHPVEKIRFHMSYRGQTYYVGEASKTDSTMPVLAFLNALMNLNRDANEIPSTKTVATSP
jgi:hypothetical protein